jgi:hypothetical protein
LALLVFASPSFHLEKILFMAGYYNRTRQDLLW